LSGAAEGLAQLSMQRGISRVCRSGPLKELDGRGYVPRLQEKFAELSESLSMAGIVSKNLSIQPLRFVEATSPLAP
jgi:hypothetical protein